MIKYQLGQEVEVSDLLMRFWEKAEIVEVIEVVSHSKKETKEFTSYSVLKESSSSYGYLGVSESQIRLPQPELKEFEIRAIVSLSHTICAPDLANATVDAIEMYKDSDYVNVYCVPRESK